MCGCVCVLLFSLITLWPLEEQVSYMYFFLLTAIRRKKVMNQICFINIHFVCQCLGGWNHSIQLKDLRAQTYSSPFWRSCLRITRGQDSPSKLYISFLSCPIHHHHFYPDLFFCIQPQRRQDQYRADHLQSKYCVLCLPFLWLWNSEVSAFSGVVT